MKSCPHCWHGYMDTASIHKCPYCDHNGQVADDYEIPKATPPPDDAKEKRLEQVAYDSVCEFNLNHDSNPIFTIPWDKLPESHKPLWAHIVQAVVAAFALRKDAWTKLTIDLSTHPEEDDRYLVMEEHATYPSFGHYIPNAARFFNGSKAISVTHWMKVTAPARDGEKAKP